MQETVGPNIRKHRDLAIQLILLLAKQVRNGGIVNTLDRDLVEFALEDGRVQRQRAVVKSGSF